MKETLISIIIPIYNREHCMERCIDSALHQKGVSTEIILVDDGSTDNSGAICDKYASLYENVKAVHKANGGVSDARNVGLQNADGEYLCFLDSDDCLVENGLNCMLSYCIKYDADLCIGGFSRYDTDGQFIDESVFPSECTDKLMNEDGLWLIREKGKLYITDVLWGKLFKREIFRDISFPVGKINEDTYVFPEIARKCKRVYATSEIVYRQNLSKKSIMSNRNTKDRLDSVDAFIEVLKYSAEKGYYNAALKDFGLASRRLIINNRAFTDKEIKKIMKSQYRELSDIARKMIPASNFKIRMRLILFRLNLPLYGVVRDYFAYKRPKRK